MNGGIKGGYFTFGLSIFLVLSLILISVKPIYGSPTSVIVPCDPNDLTGKWSANDGATYFIRQIGNKLWWFGALSLQEGTGFSNVFHGQLYAEGAAGPYIYGDWQDVPFGNNRGYGQLVITLDPSGQKLFKSSGEGFSATEWTKNCRTLGEILRP